jgi:hypothetical protein
VRLHDAIVLVHDLFVNGLVEYVYLCGGKLARGNLLLKEHVELGKGAAAGLGEAEVGVDDAAEADSALQSKVSFRISSVVETNVTGRERLIKGLSYPEEAGVIAPVPSLGIQHVWRQDVGDDAHNVATRGKVNSLMLVLIQTQEGI